jgi:DNA polymerase III subunit epsilon
MQPLTQSLFHRVIYPPAESSIGPGKAASLVLEQMVRYSLPLDTLLLEHPFVVFDFETTGLDTKADRIVELGAIRFSGGKEVARFERLVNPERSLGRYTTAISGITEDMLASAPAASIVLPEFIRFIDGAILIAHNAEFDWAFLRNACQRLGIALDWPCVCTLKMSRRFLPELERRTLDALAQHLALKFAARHRSVGDAEVTKAVFLKLWESHRETLSDWDRFREFWVA